MRIITISFVFAGMNIAFQGIFQAIDGGLQSLIVSLLRQLVLVLPVAWGFSLLVLGGAPDMLMWWVFPIAEAISALVSVIFMIRLNKTKIAVLERFKQFNIPPTENSLLILKFYLQKCKISFGE